MKKALVALLFILGTYAIEAQELVWNNNLKNAIEVSKKTKKPLLLFFTGSDWCGWCIRLQTEVFKTPEFVKWANENVVLVELDFPRRTALAPEITEQNNQLQQFFAVQGYPTVWFVNATVNEGKINIDKLGTTGYLAGGPKVWLDTANGILKKK